MIDMTLHGKYLYAEAFTFKGCEFLESVFHTRDIEYLSSVAGAEYKVIVDQRHCCFCSSIIIVHVYII